MDEKQRDDEFGSMSSSAAGVEETRSVRRTMKLKLMLGVDDKVDFQMYGDATPESVDMAIIALQSFRDVYFK